MTTKPPTMQAAAITRRVRAAGIDAVSHRDPQHPGAVRVVPMTEDGPADAARVAELLTAAGYTVERMQLGERPGDAVRILGVTADLDAAAAELGTPAPAADAAPYNGTSGPTVADVRTAVAQFQAELDATAPALAAALADDVPVDPMTAPCFACNAEPGERCRPGCTGEAVIADALAEAEDLDRCATGCTCTDAERRTTGEAGPTRRERRAVARMPRRATGRRMSRADLVAAMRARIATA